MYIYFGCVVVWVFIDPYRFSVEGEIFVERLLRRFGWLTVRTPGSRGAFDVLAWIGSNGNLY